MTLCYCRWDIFSEGRYYISPVSPERTAACESPSHTTVEQFHLLWLFDLSCQVSIPSFQNVLVNKFRALWRQSKVSFSISAPPPYQPEASYLEHGVSEPLCMELGTIILNFLFIQSSAGEYPLESGVDVYGLYLSFNLSITPGKVWSAGYMSKLIL